MDLPRIQHKLRVERQAFLDDLRPEYIMPALVENKVLTSVEQQQVLNADFSSEEQTGKLLDIVSEKNMQEMKYFLKALRVDKDDCSPYPWLADILEKKDELSAEAFPVNNLLNRELKLKDIRQKLKNASESPRHWVVLHGPIGSGKTVLAAEAVRNNDVVENIFPGGIYWIYIGGSIRGEKEEEIKKKMKHLFQLMNCKNELYQDESINNLNYCLRKEITNRKKTLVILDRVFSKAVISAFDIGCTILVTTNDKKLMDSHSSSDSCTPVDCPYDLKEDEVMSIISMYVRLEPDEMPIIPAQNIRDKCKKSPLLTRLISLRLAGLDPEWWSNFDEKLEKKGMGTLRRRRESGDYYKTDIVTLVHYSLESIKEHKKFYQDFLIFAKDIPVPHEVLEILWGEKPFKVKEIMDELHLWCFVDKVKTENSKYPAYMPHDIYLDVLQEDIEGKDTWVKERHKCLIDQLRIGPSGDIDLTAFPKYIADKICYHLCEAKENGLLENVCCNLRFIEQKLRITKEPENLYLDYHLYKPFFKNPKHVQKFEEFVRKNAVNILKGANIIQLALFEPTDSIVYEKAKAIVSYTMESSSPELRNLYDWCNKEENDLHFNCKVRDSTQNRIIMYAVFNSDGSLVATVGDTFAVIFSSQTGVELMELNGHSDAIVHCAFNSAGDRLATASEDTKVKIFKIDESSISSDTYSRKRLSVPFVDITRTRRIMDNSIYTFSQHNDKLVCCEFSPNDLYIISADITGVICVWEMNPSENCHIIKHMVKQYNELHPFKYSCFSSDSTMFGTCSNNVIKIWGLEDGIDPIEISTITYELPVQNFCFSKDDSLFTVINNDVYESYLKDMVKRSVLDLNRSSGYVITCCCLSPDGCYLAYGTSSYSVVIINVHSQNVVAYFQGHNDIVINVMFSKNGKKLLSVSSSRYIIHDIIAMTDKPLTNFANNLSVRMKEDIFIASSNYFNSIEVRKGLEGKLLASSKPSEDPISACSLSYDCKTVVYGDVTGCLKVFNLDSKNSVDCLPHHSNRITSILHSKYNKTFFTCSEDSTIGIWRDYANPLILKGHTQPVLMCVEFQEGDKLLSCSKDGTMKVWSTLNGKLLLRIDEGHGNADVRFCDISPAGELLASASSDETLKVWDSENGQRRKDFKDESDENASVKCCRFLPKKNVLASGHDNGKVKLWHLLGQPPVDVLRELHDSPVHDILYRSDDSLKLLTLSNDIKLWHHNNLLQTIILPSSSMGFAPPNIWASDDFDVIVVILNNILYILKRI